MTPSQSGSRIEGLFDVEKQGENRNLGNLMQPIVDAPPAKDSHKMIFENK